MAFYNTNNNGQNFVISFSKNPLSEFGIFAKGYFHAASKLSDDLLLQGSFPDYAAYPIVFLYRHALELHLKNIIYKSAALAEFKFLPDVDHKLYNNHRLIPLSEKATTMLEKLFPVSADIKRISAMLKTIAREFSEIDADSFSYRYPVDKQGQSSTKPHQIVNLEAFHRTMSQLLGELDIIDFGLDIETDKAQEIYEILEELQAEILSSRSESDNND